MRLEDRDGQSLQLTVLRYQFAGGDNEYDLNWLIVRGEVRTHVESWSFEDPCLLAAEATTLGSWLRHVTNPQAYYQRLDFIEPNLAFDVAARSEDAVTIRVFFELEARPRGSEGSVGDDDCWLDLNLEIRSLQTASDEWLAELELFPVRRA
jgi:hypothetical protein